MPILTGDIKLVASQVMDDVPEGGGAPTATVILDGTSNAIFPDISELDRAGGRVNLRKLHISVQTADTATYMGSNVIVAEPPADPNVSVTLFTTGNTFDRRDAAKGRIESYLTQGPEWGGYLFENHIQGQRAIQIFQRPATTIPAIGHTLVLIYNEGLQSEVKQYIRITRTVSEIRTFYDEVTQKDYEAQVVTAEISDALRTDFLGTPPKRSFTRDATSTHLRDTLVADAGTYAGVVPLTAPVALGALASHVGSVYTQLVPSAQTEIPLVDYNAAGQSTALTASANGTVSYATAQALTSTTSLSLGFAVLPGTLRITSGAVVLTDAGGEVFIGTSSVGLIDYARGLITLAGLTSSYTGSKTVVFTPASAPMRLPNTSLRQVTQETRAYNYTMVALPTPAPGSVVVSYMSNGNWYDLRDNGSGALKGLDTSFGVGTVNYTTGSILLTCGALPDVGSAILWGWNSPNNYINRSTLSIPASLVRLQVAHPPIQPASVVVTWNNGTAHTATDDGKGNLTGAATGKVYYETGLVELSPTALPAGGQQYSVAYSSADAAAAKAESYESAVQNPDGSVVVTLNTPGVTPGTVRLGWYVHLADGVPNNQYGNYQRAGWSIEQPHIGARDDGNGVIKTTSGAVVGSIVYATGVITLHPNANYTGLYYDYRLDTTPDYMQNQISA